MDEAEIRRHAQSYVGHLLTDQNAQENAKNARTGGQRDMDKLTPVINAQLGINATKDEATEIADQTADRLADVNQVYTQTVSIIIDYVHL